MKEQQAMTRIGIDFGGVIVRNRKLVRDEDTGLAGSDKAAVAQDGVFDAIHEIISKAGPRMQARTRAWLDTVDFFSRTGFGYRPCTVLPQAAREGGNLPRT